MAPQRTSRQIGINRRDALRMGIAAGALAVGGGLLVGPRTARADGGDSSRGASCGPIEPKAGTWQMWLFPSVSGLRVAPPPGAAMTRHELNMLETLAAQRQAMLDRIRFWNAGAAYRWANVGLNTCLKGGFGINPLNGQPLAGLTLNRNLGLVMTAIYDAVIAAWDSKYAYKRERPGERDSELSTAIAAPQSPSYPSEHAAVGAAASTILSYLYPQQASALAALAAEQVLSRQVAGVEYPSDVAAGLALGQRVGAAAVQRAKTDGAETPWTGTIPTVDPTGHGNPLWNGTNPIFPAAGTWKTWVLSSQDLVTLRAPQYPDFSSAAGMADLNDVVNFNRALNGPNFSRNAEAFFAQTNQGQAIAYSAALSQRIQEERLQDNEPRTARVYALQGVAGHDAMVACFGSKYYYWRIRPFQAHPGQATLFPSPNHPSYPAAHGAGSGAAGEIAAFLFPRDAVSLRADDDMLAQSRRWAGIHYQTDIDAGLAQGKAVAQEVIRQRGTIDGVPSGAAASTLEACAAD